MTTTNQASMPNRIRSVTIEGFRNFRDMQRVELAPLTVLIGANGAGKSNVIHFFEMLSAMCTANNLQDFVSRHGGGDVQRFMGTCRAPCIRAELVLDTDAGRYDYRFKLAPALMDDTVRVVEEAYRIVDPSHISIVGWTALDQVKGESGLLDASHSAIQPIAHLLRQCNAYQFHGAAARAAIRKRWAVTDVSCLRADGGNLAPILLDLRKTQSKRYALIVKQIRRVLPSFKDFVLEEEAGEVLLRWVGRQGDQVFGSQLMSDGSLCLVCLVTLLSLPPERLPDVMCFDEPELGLHPHALGLVAEMFKRLSVRRQIVIATQSPHLVDCFELEHILVVSAPSGEAVLRKLSREHYQTWLDDGYSISDIWLKEGVGSEA